MARDTRPSTLLLEDLACGVRLREGPGGVERFLWALARAGACTTRELSQQLGIPLPVVAALRRELEKRGYLSRGKGMHLSPAGEDLVRNLWGSRPPRTGKCPQCDGTGILDATDEADLLPQIEQMCRQRPSPDVKLDQAHLDPRCLLRKARFLVASGFIVGRRVLLLGDDDFLSLTILMALKAENVDISAADLQVLDLDPRVLETIQELAAENGFRVGIHLHDAREPLPHSLHERFDSVITDPPYTLGALETFLERADEALDSARLRMIALSFGRKSDPEQVEIQNILTCHGLALREMHPGFNQYLGAAVLAGTSDLYLLTQTSATPPSVTGDRVSFYTAEARHGPRVYRCLACGHRVDVGSGQKFTTIDALKRSGCPKCGKNRFRYGRS